MKSTWKYFLWIPAFLLFFILVLLLVQRISNHIAAGEQEAADHLERFEKIFPERSADKIVEEVNRLNKTIPHPAVSMTPDQVLALCGKPDREDLIPNLDARTLIYRVSPHRQIGVSFTEENNNWRLIGFMSTSDNPPNVQNWLSGFTQAMAFQALPCLAGKATGELGKIIIEASNRNGVDPDLVVSVIRWESNFNPNAISPKGARGLMQLMPETAVRMGVNDSFDPAENIDGGTRYLHELLTQYNGNLIKTLAAYNAGPDRVAQFNGVPPYAETLNYVSTIVNEVNQKKEAH
jgi:hypothetical protein